MIKITDYAHQLLAKHPHPIIAVDMTCGRGFDTIFLANIAKKVYAFDIQHIAIEETKKAIHLKELKHVTLIEASHEQFDAYVSKPIDLMIFNLGYLPGGDHSITTDALTVLNALKKALNQLNDLGIIVIVIYLHTLEESLQIEAYLKSLDAGFDVLKHQVLNKENCPYILEVKKVKK